MQRFHDEAIQCRSLVPDLGKTTPGCGSGNALAGMVPAGGRMPKGARAVSEHEMQICIFVECRRNLRCKQIQLFRPHGIGADLVGNQRSAEFEKKKTHEKNVARSGAGVKKV